MAEMASRQESCFSTTEQAGIVTIETCAGLELGLETRLDFERTLAEAAGNAACQAMVLDLSQAAFMDCSNLQVLQRAQADLRSQEKTLVLDVTGPQNGIIRRLLEVTELMDQFFVVTDTPPVSESGSAPRRHLRLIQGATKDNGLTG